MSGATVWIKLAGVPGARYGAVRGLSPSQTVDELIRKLLHQAKLPDVSPWLVTLRLVACAAGVAPTPAQEAAATELDARLTLREAAVADGASLLATIALSLTGVRLRVLCGVQSRCCAA